MTTEQIAEPTPPLTKTQEVLIEMLKERVPTSFLDSGGTPKYENGVYVGSSHGYGRHFERNQSRNFVTEPDSTVSFRHGEIDVVHNIFHWCCEKLTYDEDADKAFDEFRTAADPDDKSSWLELMRDFPAWYAKHKTEKDLESEYLGEGDGWRAGGIYGDGEPCLEYTYNSENLLGQDIQFVYFDLRSTDNKRYSVGEYVVMQIHGGADARGGFTRPHVFTCNDELSVFEYGRATIYCAGPPEVDDSHQLPLPGVEVPMRSTDDHSWCTTNGYHWEANHIAHGLNLRLEEYETRELKELDERDLVEMSEEDAAGARADARWVGGLLFWKEDGTGLCPLCGGQLAASSM